MFRVLLGPALAVSLSACVATEQVRFNAAAGQTALVREGRPAISSVGRNSIVLLSRVARELPAGQRVGYVLAMHSRTQAPLPFEVRNVEAVQTYADRPSQPIEVLTLEKLEREERTRQVVGAILVGLAAGANAAAASRAGYYNTRTTLYTPRGTYVATTSGYNPVVNAIAQGNAAAQNAAMIDAAVAQGQANLARLESTYVKDHTLLPGEWYGGVVGIEPPAYSQVDETKTYVLSVKVGDDVHRFSIIQEPVKRQ